MSILLTDEEIAQAMHYPEVTMEARMIASAQLKKVVEWIEEHWFYGTCTNVNGQTMTYKTLLESEWQALLKEAEDE